MVKRSILLIAVISCISLSTGCSKDTESPELKMTVEQYRPPTTTAIQTTEPVTSTMSQTQESQIVEPSPDMYETEWQSESGLGGLDFSNLPTVETTTKEQPTEQTTTEYVPPTTIAAVVETTQYVEPTTVGVAQETTVPEETKAAITETESVPATEQGISMVEGSGEMSKGVEATYKVRGAVAFKKKIVVPDVVGYDKDAYGNYIIDTKTLAKSQLQLPKFTEFGGRIPYCLWYDANGEVLNPLPEEYMNHKNLFYTGE